MKIKLLYLAITLTAVSVMCTTSSDQATNPSSPTLSVPLAVSTSFEEAKPATDPNGWEITLYSFKELPGQEGWGEDGWKYLEFSFHLQNNSNLYSRLYLRAPIGNGKLVVDNEFEYSLRENCGALGSGASVIYSNYLLGSKDLPPGFQTRTGQIYCRVPEGTSNYLIILPYEVRSLQRGSSSARDQEVLVNAGEFEIHLSPQNVVTYPEDLPPYFTEDFSSYETSPPTQYFQPGEKLVTEDFEIEFVGFQVETTSFFGSFTHRIILDLMITNMSRGYPLEIIFDGNVLFAGGEGNMGGHRGSQYLKAFLIGPNQQEAVSIEGSALNVIDSGDLQHFGYPICFITDGFRYMVSAQNNAIMSPWLELPVVFCQK